MSLIKLANEQEELEELALLSETMRTDDFERDVSKARRKGHLLSAGGTALASGAGYALGARRKGSKVPRYLGAIIGGGSAALGANRAGNYADFLAENVVDENEVDQHYYNEAIRGGTPYDQIPMEDDYLDFIKRDAEKKAIRNAGIGGALGGITMGALPNTKKLRALNAGVGAGLGVSGGLLGALPHLNQKPQELYQDVQEERKSDYDELA